MHMDEGFLKLVVGKPKTKQQVQRDMSKIDMAVGHLYLLLGDLIGVMF